MKDKYTVKTYTISPDSRLSEAIKRYQEENERLKREKLIAPAINRRKKLSKI